MSKKKVFALALAVCMIAILSFSTLAWFNATDTVTNQFYVASSDNDGTPDFAIDVKEEKADEDGNQIPGDYTDDGNTYKDILPGDKLAKIVQFRNTGKYDQWVRVHITFSDSAVWQKAIAKGAAAEGVDFDTYVLDHLLVNLFDWDCEPEYEVNYNIFGEDTMTYTFYYSKVVKPTNGIHVMTAVQIPEVLEQEDMVFGTDGFTLKITAEAVQVDNIEATKASEAFAKVGWEIGEAYGE